MYSTEQEKFWASDFGDGYIERSQYLEQDKGKKWIASNIALFSNILKSTRNVDSVLEFGANIGLNLIALRPLLPTCELSAIEINETAVEQLKTLKNVNAIHGSILDCELDFKVDLTLIKGVLIHINPDALHQVYERLYHYTNKYIVIAEYYNPTPVTTSYRGHNERLFKRDFAGEIMDKYSDLKLVDYGFVYRRDPNYPQDDITWFLLEKSQ